MLLNNNSIATNLQSYFFSDPDFIKKSKINYFDCDLKGLHEGEKMLLVCLDAQCQKKGLICPVCKEQNHKNHEVVHLKVFLSELQSKLIKRQDADQDKQQKIQYEANTKSLSQYLRLLEQAKKNTITSLQESVRTLAQAVKQVEKKIQDQYIRIRRIVLSQKSFQTKLPKIYKMLIAQAELDRISRAEIEGQIKKLTELLQKNSKKDNLAVANDIDKIVEMYSKNSDTCTAYLLSLMTDLPKKLNDLPVKLKNIVSEQEKSNKNEASKVEYKFSQNQKANSLLISEDKKSIAILSPEQLGGVAFIETINQSDNDIRRINLKIVGSVSDSISLGVGSVDRMKQMGFVIQQMENEGLFGICSMGININDIESPTFVFSQGDIIEITFNPVQSKLTFGRRNGLEKQEIDLGLGVKQASKLKFFVNLLLYGDSVEIVQ